MELGRIELPSAMGINLPIVHRLSTSDPQCGDLVLTLPGQGLW